MPSCRNLSLFSRLLAVVACGGLLTAPHSARADRSPSSESKTLHEWATFGGFGGPIGPVTNPIGPIHIIPFGATGGTLSISGSISVTGSDPLPISFPSFKSGTVDLAALLRSGSTSGKISVSVSGYNPGVYTVSTVTESSSSTVVLGTLTVTSGSFPSLSGSGTGLHIPANVIIGLIFKFLNSGQAVFGGKAAPFPAGFSPFDVATLSLSDSNSNVVATTILTPVPSGYYTALSPLTGGTATGYALIRADTPPRLIPLLGSTIGNLLTAASSAISPIIDPVPPIAFRGPQTGALVIHAHGLPASTELTYAADGTDIGTATTDSVGNLTVYAAQGYKRKLPSTLDLFSVTTVTVHDASGTVYASASF